MAPNEFSLCGPVFLVFLFIYENLRVDFIDIMCAYVCMVSFNSLVDFIFCSTKPVSVVSLLMPCMSTTCSRNSSSLFF